MSSALLGEVWIIPLANGWVFKESEVPSLPRKASCHWHPSRWTLIQGLLKPPRNSSGDTESDTWCLTHSYCRWYSVGSLGIINLFKGGFYFIAQGKMNARSIILKSRFLSCPIWVPEEGLLFQNLTCCMEFILPLDSFVDRTPPRCLLHVGRNTCFPGCSFLCVTLDRSIGNQKPEHRELSLLGGLVNIHLSKPLMTTVIHHSTKYLRNAFCPEVGTLLVSLAHWWGRGFLLTRRIKRALPSLQ